MMLKAVWFKDGKEIAWCDPVLDIMCEERQNISEIEVYNGHSWYSSKDLCDEIPDDFVIRVSRSIMNSCQ